MVKALPAPSLRELLSECEAEGVYPDERNRSKITEFIMTGGQTVGTEEPSDDTPSVSPSGCQLPQRGSREWLVPFIGVLANIRGYGRFSSPLRNSECLTAPIHRGTLPQSRPLGVPAPSEREPGCGLCHSMCRPETGRVRAIFIAPTKLKSFYISPFNPPGAALN